MVKIFLERIKRLINICEVEIKISKNEIVNEKLLKFVYNLLNLVQKIIQTLIFHSSVCVCKCI